jgi:hypothetical protein
MNAAKFKIDVGFQTEVRVRIFKHFEPGEGRIMADDRKQNKGGGQQGSGQDAPGRQGDEQTTGGRQGEQRGQQGGQSGQQAGGQKGRQQSDR